jgi:hypothetical protein
VAASPRQALGASQGLESGDELAAKDARQRAHRKQETLLRRDPFTACRQRPAGYQRMQMDMSAEILLPRVQHQRERRHAAQMSRVGGELGKRCRYRREQRLVERPWCGGNQAIEVVRQREHQVKVRHGQHFTPPCGDPGFLRPGLALRAVPVPARVIDVPGRAAVVTGFDVTAEDRRATGKDRTPDAGCPARQRLTGEVSLAEGGQHPGQAGRFHRRRSAGREQFERRGGTG